jgi:hypothetical protein
MLVSTSPTGRMNTRNLTTASADNTSYPVDISEYSIDGFCQNYELRRHRFESEANAGCHEARSDWVQHIGPIQEFGGFNPDNGNFTALVLPLCRPDRLRLVAYVLECKTSRTSFSLLHVGISHALS